MQLMQPSICFIGYGELAHEWCRALSSQNVGDLRAFVRRPRELDITLPPDGMVAIGAVRVCTTLAEAVSGADIVIAAIPGVAIVEMAAQCARLLEKSALYVDVASGSPDQKVEAAAVFAGIGPAYVDAAVMGSVVGSALQVPIIASGTGAAAWAKIFSSFGARIRVIPGPAGDAARLKLLRSVYMKGRDALIVEMIAAARRLGVEKEVMESIVHPPSETFEAVVERVWAALVKHASRRADELVAAADVLSQVGVLPIMTEAAAKRLRAFPDVSTEDGV